MHAAHLNRTGQAGYASLRDTLVRVRQVRKLDGPAARRRRVPNPATRCHEAAGIHRYNPCSTANAPAKATQEIP